MWLSLAVRGPEGLVLLVLIFGGLHLPAAPDSTVGSIVSALKDPWAVARIAPGHCTGEPAFAALRRIFGPQYVYAGLGTVIEVP
jgi:7,8-dihydropterin-6-yl-methyl-4-(beta-D-ribofuranosyl)aminobenzene 5'-phosphate synthase